MSCLVWVELARGTSTKPFDVVADALDDREGLAVVGPEQARLSRQARGAFSEHKVAGEPAGPWRRPSECCWISGLELLLSAIEFEDRT